MALLRDAEALDYPQESLFLLFVFFQLALHLPVLLLKFLIASLIDGSPVCTLSHNISELRESSLHFLELFLTAMG